MARSPIVRNQSVTARKPGLAKSLRRRMTGAEAALWKALRGNRINGLHFRRQQVVGNHIVDFYCDAARLAIELDVVSHALRSKLDTQREAALSALGIKVLRIPNDVIIRGDLDLVARWISEQTAGAPRNRTDPTPTPSRTGRGTRERMPH